uniref:Uncharacterized protein n=1 Tax=Anguilla anguilla TaxID=7936 RepID=A0A0E9QVH4_ANGAN
MLRFCFFDI